MYQLTLVLDHEEAHLERAVEQGANMDESNRSRCSIRAGDSIRGTVYLDLSKTVIGTYVSLELFRREISEIAKHGKSKVKHVLLQKLYLAPASAEQHPPSSSWKDGYMKPGNYQLGFEFSTKETMVPTMNDDLIETYEMKQQQQHQQPQSQSSGFSLSSLMGGQRRGKNKVIKYFVKVRFPGDSGQRAKTVKDREVHIVASEHPTLQVI